MGKTVKAETKAVKAKSPFEEMAEMGDRFLESIGAESEEGFPFVGMEEIWK